MEQGKIMEAQVPMQGKNASKTINCDAQYATIYSHENYSNNYRKILKTVQDSVYTIPVDIFQLTANYSDNSRW